MECAAGFALPTWPEVWRMYAVAVLVTTAILAGVGVAYFLFNRMLTRLEKTLERLEHGRDKPN